MRGVAVKIIMICAFSAQLAGCVSQPIRLYSGDVLAPEKVATLTSTCDQLCETNVFYSLTLMIKMAKNSILRRQS